MTMISTLSETKIQAEVGSAKFRTFAIGVQGSSEMRGELRGNVDTFDWTLLYELYGLPRDAALSEWVKKFKASEERIRKERILKLLFPLIEKRAFKVDLKFNVRGNDSGITSLSFDFRVLRLTYGKVTKDFMIVNRSCMNVKDPKGNPYAGVTVVSGP